MSIQIKEIAFVSHPVGDIPRARKFYEEVLGLKPGLQVEFQPGTWWIEYEIGGVALAISNAFAAAKAGGAGLALEVDSLDETLASIKAAGVPVALEPQDFPPCRMFAVTSPDGHSIMFHQRKG
jgi:catechol 2,3-dioxygenase-like lactoylglutathione lyase family enzyme